MTGFGQIKDFQLSKLTYRGIPFTSEKEVIVSKFGEPKIEYPNYECGFYADEETNRYYQLHYDHCDWIGNENENFIIEHIKFENDNLEPLIYGDYRFDGNTSRI